MVTSQNNNSSDSGMGFLVGIVLLIIFGVAFFIYGLPMIQKAMNDGVNVNVHPDKVQSDTVKVEMEQPQSTQ